MGHVDHGKSTLLDTIRNTNTVDDEAGGITQHVAAYEVATPDASGTPRTITFIDTPGHAAFSGARARSATIADIAILIIAADDGIKPQTLEALRTIQEGSVPFLIAFNKIDTPGADIDRCIRQLMEAGVYVEGYGGDISYVKISAKKGLGIDELLETILLLSEFIDLSYDPLLPASGFILESHTDTQRGIAATLLIKNGTLHKQNFVAAGQSIAGCKSFLNFAGKQMTSATASTPITLYGFNETVPAGIEFTSHDTKESAELTASQNAPIDRYCDTVPPSDEMVSIPVVVKCDVIGSIDAIISEIKKHNTERVFFKIVHAGTGNISESDIRMVASDTDPLIVGFNVDVDKRAIEMDEYKFVIVEKFSIIYRMSEWLADIASKRKFKKEVERVIGSGQILKLFSQEKNQHLVGLRVATGVFQIGNRIRIVRNRELVAKGKVISIQMGKSNSQKVEAGNDCGMMAELTTPPRQFDILECYDMVEG
jgi:translation initiation factor IF-2